MKYPALIALSAMLLLVSSCGDGKVVRLGPKTWGDIDFVVEPRPSPPRVGMNEFIVIASRDNYKPVVDLVVSLRVDKNAEWHQVIQDGFTGVYRGAIHVNDPQNGVLQVQIRKINKELERIGKKEEKDTVLYFPLNKPGMK